ncbi:MAG: hypothetical protein HFE75_08525 [Firmicutes bacterium]|nr:hypothetical protein [Bacillota bacterium]NBI63610.1 hypothetical protein [Clostridiales bacterium]
MTVDERIIELFFQRSEEAIEELDAKYGTVCRKLSHNILGSQQDAEECVSEWVFGDVERHSPDKAGPTLALSLQDHPQRFVVCAGALLFLKEHSDSGAKFPVLTVTNALSDGAGFGGFLAFDVSELVNGNLWDEETSPATLPVYKRIPPCDDSGAYLEDGDQKKKKALLLDTAKCLGLDMRELKSETENYGYDEDPATMLTAKSKGITISVDAEMNVKVEFEPAVSLPKEYRFTDDASYEEHVKTAEYLKKAYKDLVHMEDPQVNIYGGWIISICHALLLLLRGDP